LPGRAAREALTRRLATQGEITAIRRQARHAGRVNIELDGLFAFGLAGILAARLKVGQVLSAGQVDELLAQDEVEAGYQKAIKLVGRRPRTEREIRRYLQGKGLTEDAQQAVVAQLRHSGWLDDAAFARMWVENRTAFRPRGSSALRAELRQKGVPAGAIEDALSDWDEVQAVYRAASKAARRYQNTDCDDFHKRVGAYLARRGFQQDQIRAVVPRVWREISEGESEGRT
jgi:regulatory protein